MMKQIPLPVPFLSPNHELWLLLAKPRLETSDSFDNIVAQDQPRAAALALARNVFQTSVVDGGLHLATKVQNSPAVVVFPEYAFGSGDFAAVDALVRAQPMPLVVLAGFGATLGSQVQPLLASGQLEAGWPDGVCIVDPALRYNGLWCWVHVPGQATKCVVSFKHAPQQANEPAIVPNWGEGRGHFSLLGPDLTIVPIICADFVLDRADGPRRLAEDYVDAIGDPTRRVLIVSLNADTKPYHATWQTVIDSFTGRVHANVAVAACNLLTPEPQSSEANDQFRCLTGVFVKTANADSSRVQPHSYARRSRTAASAGYLLRAADAGAACGLVQWECAGNANRYVWRPIYRLVWAEPPKLENEHAAGVEFRRWPKRIEFPVPFSAGGRELLKAPLESISEQFGAGAFRPKFWPGLLLGSQPATAGQPDIDELPSQLAWKQALDHAFIALAAIKAATNLPLDFTARTGHFIRESIPGVASHSFFVWSSPILTTHEQHRLLKAAALNWEFQVSTRVVARAVTGSTVPAGELTAETEATTLREADYTADLPEQERTFTAAKLAPVHYLPYPDFEDTLVVNDTVAALSALLRTALGEANAA
jgi:hypothetical protein